MFEPALFGAGGAIINDIALGYTRGYLPASFQSGLGQDALRLAQALGLGWAAQKFIKGRRGEAIAAGMLVVATYQLAKDLLVQTVGSGTFPVLGDYEEVVLSNNPAGGGMMDGYIHGYLPDGSREAMGSYLQGEGAHMGGSEF